MKRGTIEFWSYIIHKPDTDDKKEHIHLFMIPAKMIETTTLLPEFIEPDPIAGIPRKSLRIDRSNFGDWYLYGLHDREYLKAKGKEKNVHYSRNDFKSSDDDSMNMMINEIDVVALKGYANMIESALKGIPFSDALIKGIIPMSRVQQWGQTYQAILNEGRFLNHG